MHTCVPQNSDYIQVVIALLLIVNFLINIIQTELQPEADSDLHVRFTSIDSVFTIGTTQQSATYPLPHALLSCSTPCVVLTYEHVLQSTCAN